MPSVRLRWDFEIHFHAGDACALHVTNLRGDAVQLQLRGQRAQPVAIETHGEERAQRHVSGDPAEGMKDCDRRRHQVRYEDPLPVLNTTTSASAGTRPSLARRRSTA